MLIFKYISSTDYMIIVKQEKNIKLNRLWKIACDHYKSQEYMCIVLDPPIQHPPPISWLDYPVSTGFSLVIGSIFLSSSFHLSIDFPLEIQFCPVSTALYEKDLIVCYRRQSAIRASHSRTTHCPRYKLQGDETDEIIDGCYCWVFMNWSRLMHDTAMQEVFMF